MLPVSRRASVPFLPRFGQHIGRQVDANRLQAAVLVERQEAPRPDGNIEHASSRQAWTRRPRR